MTVLRIKPLIIIILIFMMSGSMLRGDSLDISDEAVQQFIESPFQYDYTTITDELSLRHFIDALDYQLAMIEYRQRREFTSEPDQPIGRQRFKNKLEERYRELMRDGFIFKKLNEWQSETDDSVNLAFIRLYIARRNEFVSDPTMVNKARELSRRIADRLYAFQFRLDGERYGAAEAARIIFGGGDLETARGLQNLINDSVAVLARDASNLYLMYKALGQQRGHRTSMDYNLSRLSFRKPEWLKIADDLKKITGAEYRRCLKYIKTEAALDNLALFEIERRINAGAVLPDSCFPPEKIDSAIKLLLDGMGLSEMFDQLTVRVDSSSYPALAIRLLPPYDNLLLKNGGGGFANYYRLAGEIGRALPWAYADTTLPYLLRDYPFGSEEMLTGLFENMALQSDFLADNFSIAPEDLKRFEKHRRWQEISQIRRILLYFYFDYYLSEETATDPVELYVSLENELFGTVDTSHQWVETLLTGGLELFPEKLAHTFSRIKTAEILYNKFGENYSSDPAAGRFLIESFCLPGRSRTIEDYITQNAPDRLSVEDFKRQLQMN